MSVWPSLQYCWFECTQGWRLLCCSQVPLCSGFIRPHSSVGREAALCHERGEGWVGTVTVLCCDSALLPCPTSHVTGGLSQLHVPVVSSSGEYGRGLFAYYSLQVLSSSRDLLSKKLWYNSRNLKRLSLHYCSFFALCPSGWGFMLQWNDIAVSCCWKEHAHCFPPLCRPLLWP